jgi:hypothetical protein
VSELVSLLLALLRVILRLWIILLAGFGLRVAICFGYLDEMQ